MKTKDLTTRRTFTTGMIANLCEVAPRSVSKWIDGGKLPGYRLPGSADRRVKREDLVAFLRSHNLTTELTLIGEPSYVDAGVI